MSDENKQLREALAFLADNSDFWHSWSDGHCLYVDNGRGYGDNLPVPEHLLKVLEPWLEEPGPMPEHGPRKPVGLGWYPSEQSRERDIRMALFAEALTKGYETSIRSMLGNLPVFDSQARDQA